MSTRATITVHDEYDKFNIYIGHDGLSEKVIPLIEKATKHTRKFPLFEAGDFASAIIKVMKKGAGKVYLINNVEDIYGRHYHYHVLREDGELQIYTDYLRS